MKTNKWMKWMTAAVVLVMMSGSVLFAQQGGQRGGAGMDPKEMAKMNTERLAERLKLSKEQQEKIYQINLAQTEQMRKAFEAGANGGDREAMRERRMKMREESDKKILEVLDEKQKAEYKKMQEERAIRGGGRLGGPRN